MTNKIQIIIERKPEVLKRFGISNSSLYARINEGLLPPPISLGYRAVGFLSHEIDEVLAAMVVGKSNDEIRLLVAELVAKRQQLPELIKQPQKAA